MTDMVAVDFLVVPTIRFKMLFVFVVLSHDRRRVIHFNVTTNPTGQWTAQQIVEAFPWDGAAEVQLQHICFGIETESLVICFSGEFVRWVSKK
jgi:putative transposase